MKKSILALLTMVTLPSFFTFVNKNLTTNDVKKISSVVQEITQEFKNNPKLNINLINIIKIIQDNGILNIIDQKLNIFNGKLLADKYGHPTNSASIKEKNRFIFANKEYNININTDKAKLEQFTASLKSMIKNAIGKKITHLLCLAVISDLAHYYSINKEITKISDSIKTIAELIKYINDYDTDINKSGEFLTIIKSWNLYSIISDYNKQIFSNKIDEYRNINFSNLINSTLISYDKQMIQQIENIKLKTTWDTWDPYFISQFSTGSTTIDHTLVFQDVTSSQRLFTINFQQNISITIDARYSETSYYKSSSTVLHFFNLSNIDINF